MLSVSNATWQAISVLNGPVITMMTIDRVCRSINSGQFLFLIQDRAQANSLVRSSKCVQVAASKTARERLGVSLVMTHTGCQEPMSELRIIGADVWNAMLIVIAVFPEPSA